jgi:thioesterase domain-containing protein
VDGNHPFGDVPWNTVEKVYRNASKSFRPQPLDTRAVLFRSRDSTEAYLHAIDASLGWAGLFTRGLEIIESPGDHFSLLMPPHLLTLARRFQECLRQIT